MEKLYEQAQYETRRKRIIRQLAIPVWNHTGVRVAPSICFLE